MTDDRSADGLPEDALAADDADEIGSELEGEYGFEPAVRATGAQPDADRPSGDTARRPRRRVRSGSTRPEAARPSKPRSALRRRLGAGVVLLGALGVMGGAYAAFATSSGAADSANSASDIAAGRQLYETSCITCHGANLDGVTGNGPSLVGVGSAAVYFQISTGRMPLAQNGAYAVQHGLAKFDEKQTDQIGEYVESVGGGPSLPTGSLEAGDSQLGQGGELYRLNCASCHGTTFKGAPLSAGKVAPSINGATSKQIYSAMLSGPANMPIFDNNSISPQEKRQIVGYVRTLSHSADPGGNGIDRIGPVSEAIVIWVAGVGAVMIAILWIGARAR